MKPRGFTMMELMISLVILGVMASLAVPSYFRTVEQARSNEAKTNLNIIHMGQKLYRLNNGTFWTQANPTIAAANNALGTDMSAAYYTTLTMTVNGGASYTARLTRNTDAGGAGTKWFQNEFNNTTGVLTPSEGGSY